MYAEEAHCPTYQRRSEMTVHMSRGRWERLAASHFRVMQSRFVCKLKGGADRERLFDGVGCADDRL